MESPLILEMIAARRALGLTQADVAKVLGTSRTTVTNWENDEAQPRLQDFLKWAAAVERVVVLVPRSSIPGHT